MRILAGLILFLSFYAYSCEQHGDHAHHHHHEAKLPAGIKLQIPTVVERDSLSSQVDFTIEVAAKHTIDDLAIQLIPNSRVEVIGEGATPLANHPNHYQVRAQLLNEQRGAMRVVITGTLAGEAFLVSRFVMLA